ncbi:hypothetical protein MATL_G00173590 [Megalops atlanticus]|uniref:Thyroglobulin type-1 domain-containing protein n=1 Tax=Megalops atlanticus TaxID=7932 RepID=A0A9D3PRH6_MEGAT|nr:hypothetical protein MATL_G00173590 [Megalops atlanticus]
MADQQDASLLGRTESQESVVRTPGRAPMSDAKIAGITLLFCLLLAGQGLTAYFVITQKSQISTLEQSTDRLKTQLTRRPSGSSAPKMLRMPMYNMPLLMDVSSEKKEIPMTKLENTVMVSLEKQVKDLLEDPQLPQFNETFLGNLKSLKGQMEDSEWKGFESWMHHWLVFQMAQQKHPAPTPVPGESTTPLGAYKLQTKCQLEAVGGGSVKPGFYRPQCDEQGNYLPMQCWHSTGYCWCVDKNGVQIPNTLVRGRPVCGGVPGADQMMAFPSLARMVAMKDD